MNNRWLLKGLDGSNPLAFLAALGTLRTATLAWPGPDHRCRMAWKRAEGRWRPELSVESEQEFNLVAALDKELARKPNHKAFELSEDLTIKIEEFRKQAVKAQKAGTNKERRFADFLAAFGSETVKSINDPRIIADTALRTMSGVGHQHFLGTMRQLSKDTKSEHLRRALLEPWRYDDPLEKHTMRWDPHDDVRRALRWSEPSGDPARKVQGSVWGANRLAIEGLPLLPTVPVGNRVETTGFIQRKDIGVLWTWPIWVGEVSVEVVRSLLALDELRAELPDRRQLDAMGIKEIYRCERITQGRFRNFTVGTPV
jgi:hypothetical protein